MCVREGGRLGWTLRGWEDGEGETDPDSMAKKNTGEVAITFLHVAQGGFWEGKQDVTLNPLPDNHSFYSLSSYLMIMSFRSRQI